MGKSDQILPPGPNPREDQMTEKDQEQLRRLKRKEGKISSKEEEERGEEELQAADPVEGERSEGHEFRVGHTPGQAEGDRETIEEEEKRR